MNNLKKYKLSSIIEIISGGTPKTSIPEYWNGVIPWLSVKDFNQKNSSRLASGSEAGKFENQWFSKHLKKYIFRL